MRTGQWVEFWRTEMGGAFEYREVGGALEDEGCGRCEMQQDEKIRKSCNNTKM